MATVWFSEPARNELKRFAIEIQREVSKAVLLLGNDNYREQNKLDLNIIEQDYNIFSLVVGDVWLGFHEDTSGVMCVDWVSLRFRFRP